MSGCPSGCCNRERERVGERNKGRKCDKCIELDMSQRREEKKKIEKRREDETRMNEKEEKRRGEEKIDSILSQREREY